jgi:hypothetical protein
MAFDNSDEELSVPSPTSDSEFGDILLPPSTLSNQQAMAIYNRAEVFGFPSSTDSELELTLRLLAPYQELEKKFEDFNLKAFGSNKYSRASRRHIHYAGVNYSKQMLAMMAFKETEDWYYTDLENLIKYHDPRNACEFPCLLTFVTLTGS